MLNFIRKLNDNLIKFDVLTHDKEEVINQYKIDYIDLNITIHRLTSKEESLKKIENISALKNLKFKSNKLITKGDKQYPTLYHLKKEQPISSCGYFEFPEKYADYNFIGDIDFFYIYKND